MDQQPTTSRSLLGRWLRAELFLSALPFAAVAVNYYLVMPVLPVLGLLFFIAFFLYVLPAFYLIMVVCGYPLQPNPGNFVPVPADSLSSWCILFTVHAVIVTVLFGVWQTSAYALRAMGGRGLGSAGPADRPRGDA